MDAAACAKILWMISGSFSGDSDELIKIRRALAEAIFNTDGKGFPKPVDPPAKVLDSKEWNGCKNAALEVADSKQSSDDSRKNQIKFILLAPNGLEDKPDIKSPDLNIAWPVTSDVAYQAGPVFDSYNRKIHLLGYYNIDQAQAMSDLGFGSEGLYPVKLRNSLPPQISSTQRQESKGKPFKAILAFVLAFAIGIISMLWISHITQSIRMDADLILSETTTTVDKESNTGKINSIAIKDENKLKLKSKTDEKNELSISLKSKSDEKDKLSKSESSEKANEIAIKVEELTNKKDNLNKEIQGLEEKQKYLEKLRPCIEKINDQLTNDSPVIQNHKQCNDILFSAENVSKNKSVIMKDSHNNSRLSLMLPFVMSQIAIVLLVISAGYAIKGEILGAFIDTRNRMSLSGFQQILWSILIFGGFTILAIFNIALLVDYARSAFQYNPELAATINSAFQNNREPVSLDFFVYFPSLDPALWAALGITALASPLISKGIISKKKNLADENFENLEVRQDKNDVTEQRVSNRVAKWTDIFTDEKQENSNTVDISRLQHLVITGLLLGGYFILLSEYISNINATAIFYALVTGQAVFTTMPPVDGTFIGLMVFSHAGYLGFKALPPKTNS